VEPLNAQELSLFIRAAWSAAMSDNGAIWELANNELKAALAEVDESVRAEAYEIARSQS
jgi:hypothetical protein